jgi:parvulin-like peptidyl-prolyl isomerase
MSSTLHSIRTLPALCGLILALGALNATTATDAMAAQQPKASPAAAPMAASAPLPAGVIAEVNHVAISQDQLDQAVRASGAPDTPQLRQALKNQLIARELFRQVALQAHYDTHADVQAAVAQAQATAMMQAYLRDNVKPDPVTDDQIKAQYDAIIGTLGPNEFKPSVIVVDDADTAQKVVDALKKGGDFAALAKQYSKGPDAAQGGALNWISFKLPLVEGHTQNWPLPLADALTKLPQGGVSAAPIAVDGKFYLLRMDQERPTQIPQFDAIKPVLRRQLEQVALEKATAQVVLNLMKTAQIRQ